MNLQNFASKIIELEETDLAFRDHLVQTGQLGEGYHPQMEQIHNNNAAALETIIDQIGYPTVDKVGQKASDAAWLIIQHAISQPAFMKKCAALLELAVAASQANPKHLAYLTDRIAVFSDQPQRYGTSFDWDQNGLLNPNPFDDLAKVNQRRKAIGLNTLEEQTQIIRAQAKNEQQLAPPDLKARKNAYDRWRKKVGWMG